VFARLAPLDRLRRYEISVIYALELVRRGAGVTLGDAEQAYMARGAEREAYKCAMETCLASRKAWFARTSGP
jgi:glutathione S-transferase